MFRFALDTEDPSTLEYIVTHVFFPLKLPNGDDHSIRNDRSLVGAITSIAGAYGGYTDTASLPEWGHISRMLQNLQIVVQHESLDRSQIISQLSSMDAGDIRAFLIRAQNAAVLFRKQGSVTIFEAFEVSPKTEDVMNAQGRLICSYPGPAIEIPNVVFEDKHFLSELGNFLVHMNNDVLDAASENRKAKSTVVESRDTTHPRYVTELLTGILRSVGAPADIIRISKRVGDDAAWNNSNLPWRRSSLWLLIRVALQTSLVRSGLGYDSYKEFMLFFMCRVGQEAVSADLTNDLLQCMSAKLSRRLRKLGSSAPDWLSRTVSQTCNSLRLALEKRWGQVQAAQLVSPVRVLSQHDLTRDSQLSLLCSGDYLHNSLANNTINPVNLPFNPNHLRRGLLDDFLSSDGAFFDEAYRAEPHVTLYDVEQAVQQSIDTWVGQIEDNDEACERLEILANKYSSGALTTYANNPELLSIMLLTTIELWIALDKIAIEEIPMLADYSPEVPTSLLENLLLCKTDNLRRLRHAHQYLSHRHSQSQSGWSVFSPTTTTSSFAVRFYRSSPHLQGLKDRIENVAQREVDEKVAELERENARYAELQQTAAGVDHEYLVNSIGDEYHSNSCFKCRLERQCRRMEIAVHEWPLPSIPLDAEAVVFELDCPISFNMWRTATFHLLISLCSPSMEQKHPYTQLNKYAALQPYLVEHPRSRFSLGSNTKPFIITHYKKTSIPTMEERVCVNNGLNFYGFDTHDRLPASEALGRVDVRSYCTYRLPSGPYQDLQKYIDATSHTSNEVLANQADCDQGLSIHEYLAFGHLRSGGSIQWFNILRELRGRSLSSNRHEVHFLLTQAVTQVGPLKDAEWTWHREIQQSSFSYAFLEELESLLRDIEANWLEAVTMDTISFLLRRLLASSPDQNVSQKALDLLLTARAKIFSWVEELSGKLTETPEDEELRGFLRDIAATCRGTFDVDPDTIRRLLHSPEDVKVLLTSAILVHDHTPSKVSCLPTYSLLLLDRDRRLSLALENIINNVIQADSSGEGIDLAIVRVWPNYRPGSKWTALPKPNARWFSCTTASTLDQCSQAVHINLLDGSLLVDGKPLGRLPREYQRHPLYNLIFGDHVLEVLPSDLPGMNYVTRSSVVDHQVYFSLRNDSDLVIRAVTKAETVTQEIIELIPQEKLEGDLPTILIEGHVHWLNLATAVLEIRPFDKLWETSSESWTMNCSPGQYRLRKGHECLMDIRSQSWTMISNLLKPLDTTQNLLVTVTPVNSIKPSSPLRLSVALPRYRLSFYIDEDGDLQSRNIQGMVYDENQSIGTLFGLVNKLALRPKPRNINVDELVPRCVIVPEGAISFRIDGHHVRVDIDTRGSAHQRVTYQIYRLDTDLGCLTGNVNLTNKLYCVYLHALTSGCGTDPLTGRSGTEEALSLLRSASCWSIMKFSSRDAELLGLIASMCPSRTWYPAHLKRMQQVEWLSLPVNSQHYELYLVSEGIKEHYERVQLFHESQSDALFQDFPSRDRQLLERSALRAAYLFPSEFSGKPSGTGFDVRYTARDLLKVNSGEHRAHTAATVVHRRMAGSMASKQIPGIVASWNEVSGDAKLSLRYNRSWLAPNLASIWLKTYNLLRRKDERKWYQLLFSLPAVAYASEPNLSDLIPVLVAFAADPRFHLEDPPHYGSYNPPKGDFPSETTLRRYVSDCAYSFERSPESKLPAKCDESYRDMRKRQLEVYRSRRDLDTDTTVRRLMDNWPCETPPRCSLNSDLYNVANLTSNIESHFSLCYRNLKLKEHLNRIQRMLDDVHPQVFPSVAYSFQPSEEILSSVTWSITTEELFTRSAPSLQGHEKLPHCAVNVENTSPTSPTQLHELIAMIEANTENPFQRQYMSALHSSADCFTREMSLVARGVTKLPAAETLLEHYGRCKASYIKALRHLQRHLGPRSYSERALEWSGQWPRVTPYALFRSLASSSPVVLSDEWKRCLVELTLLTLELQRIRRIVQLHLDNRHEELRRELGNEGCDGWNAEAHPDWLLIQLQSNLLVRRIQADVANEMIAPHSGLNTTMQLNMGEGKSSVIVPIVAATLADGDQLVRVIIPKALTAQMFHLLADRLGGLVNRRIYFIPFSRSLNVDVQKVTALRELMLECMHERGILVIQPEHILSLRLVSVEKQLSPAKDGQLANRLLQLQKWLHLHSRDILDESDEILHVRYQLVYTIGNQQHVEGSPERWTTTEQILGLISKNATFLKKLFPLGIEYEPGPSGSFPHIRILHADAGEELISLIVQDVMDGLLPNFSFGQLHSGLRNAIRSFISCAIIHPAKVKLVQEYSQHTSMWAGLLLLRGLLATGILLFAFRERRWRVDYGLALVRTMLAVPYRAKDVPAQRAEFGHPDVAIILTCLSYYYGGLSEKQLRASFEILFRQDDPSPDYDLWVRDCPAVPGNLRTLSGVNLKSSEQWTKDLVPLFQRNRATVDFYLSNVVFPKEAKEFPSRLSCSGWDLAEKKEHLLTGFSGTNDGQHLSPLHVTQSDPEHQKGTNAKVLSYLLQPENNHYMCMSKENGERRTTPEFLELLVSQKPEIRVLLDVGAQMLDLENNRLAEVWLDINRDASAAIYFNEDDELIVRTRDGSIQLLISSPFAQQLDQCVIYLDDAHTRGTDIKFPTGFRAAVTLGPKVTKDRLVQGCMRMRKLGHGHSIIFFAPLELDRCIRSVAGKSEEAIDTTDIIRWAIHETCNDVQQRVHHWAQQGMDHSSRYEAWISFCQDHLSSETLSAKWLQPEAKKLEDLYGPHDTMNSDLSVFPDIQQRCTELGVLSLRDASMDEEQEREIIHEAEREHQVERPPRLPPTTHSLHQDVTTFVKTGVVPTNSTAFRPAFKALGATSAATSESRAWSPFVLVTTDFVKTVSSSRKLDEYLRPVQWVVSGKKDGNDVLIIVSPYEANHLMPVVRSRASDGIHLHLYTPRVTKSMKPCDDLSLYSIPAVPAGWTPSRCLMDQLNVFSGQLYLKDYETYIRLCHLLCVYAGNSRGEEDLEYGSDMFISPKNRPMHMRTANSFQRTPIPSLRKLMGIRRKGMRFTLTHMGKILDGRLLSQEDDFRGGSNDS